MCFRFPVKRIHVVAEQSQMHHRGQEGHAWHRNIPKQLIGGPFIQLVQVSVDGGGVIQPLLDEGLHSPAVQPDWSPKIPWCPETAQLHIH